MYGQNWYAQRTPATSSGKRNIRMASSRQVSPYWDNLFWDTAPVCNFPAGPLQKPVVGPGMLANSLTAQQPSNACGASERGLGFSSSTAPSEQLTRRFPLTVASSVADAVGHTPLI